MQTPPNTDVPKQPTPPPPPKKRPWYRRSVRLSGQLLLLGLALGGLVLLWLLVRPSGQQPPTSAAQVATATSSPTATARPTVVPSPTATTVPNAQPKFPLIVQAASRYEFGQPQLIFQDKAPGLQIHGWTADSLHLLVTTPYSEKEWYREVIELVTLKGEVVTDFGVHTINSPGPIISGDGQTVAFTVFDKESQNHDLYVANSVNTPLKFLANFRGLAAAHQNETLWTLDEKYNLLRNRFSQSTLRQERPSPLPLLTRQVERNWTDYEASYSIAVNPTNENQAIVHRAQEVFFVDVVADTVTELELGVHGYQKNPYWVISLQWSPDGRYVAAETTAGEPPTGFSDLTLFETTNWSYDRFEIPDKKVLLDFAWAANSRDIFFSVKRGRVYPGVATSKSYLLDVNELKAQSIPLFNDNIVGGRVFWSPDGKHLLTDCLSEEEHNIALNTIGVLDPKLCLIEVTTK